jgi:hypothetical protein
MLDEIRSVLRQVVGGAEKLRNVLDRWNLIPPLPLPVVTCRYRLPAAVRVTVTGRHQVSLAVTVTSRDQCLAVVRWLAVGGCRRRYRYLPPPAVAAASRHRYHRYRICAGNSFTPSCSGTV